MKRRQIITIFEILNLKRIRVGPPKVLYVTNSKAAEYFGEMAEWSNAAVSKTVVRLPANRGFESPSLRNSKLLPQPAAGFLFSDG